MIYTLLTSILGSVILVFAQGFSYPGSDMQLLLPRLLQNVDPKLFPHDIYFATPAKNYDAVLVLLSLWSRFFPIEIGIFLLHFVGKTLTLFGLQHLTLQTTQRGRYLLIQLVFLVTCGGTLLGNEFDGTSYHPQYTSFGFLIAAISLLGTRHNFLSGLCLVACSIFHPLIGLYGLMIMTILLIMSGYRWRTLLPVGLVAFCYYFTVFPALQHGSGGPKSFWEIYVPILIYFRAPWHFDPVTFGIERIFEFILVVFIGFCLIAREKTIFKGPFYFLAFLSTFGLLNALILHHPELTVGNLFKMTPLLLFLLFPFIVHHFQQFITKGSVLLVITVLASGSLFGLLTCFLMAMIVDVVFKKYPPTKRFFFGISVQDISVFILTILLLNFLSQIFPNFQYSVRSHVGMTILIFLVLCPFLFRYREKVLHSSAGIILLILFAKGIFGGYFPAPFVTKENIDSDWIALTRAVEEKIPHDKCVIIPPNHVNFQSLSKRCAFVSFKHFPFHPVAAVEWTKRMIALRALPLTLEDIPHLKAVIKPDWNGFENLNGANYIELKRKYPFVEACVVPKNISLPFEPLFASGNYKLYRIR